MSAIIIKRPASGYQISRAEDVVRASGIVELFEQRLSGPFGHTALGLQTLEILVSAVDLGFLAADELQGVVQESARSFHLPELTDDQRHLIASFRVIVTADAFLRRAGALFDLPEVEGTFGLDGLIDLLQSDRGHDETMAHVLRLATAFVRQQEGRPEADLAAFLLLFRGAVLVLSKRGGVKALVRALEAKNVTVAGHSYRGFEVEARHAEGTGLLSVQPSAIVGNDTYLQAGLRLAREVAGFDFELKRNPKQVNPILFGLGRPGSGKTITAHAIGNYFLDYCRERSVPARFVVVRRTDWASSYQNASALNLVRIFKEEVAGFEGVCGVYWPDIDTAFASRENDSLRMEEKQNLGAVFGVFDGTLLPQNGQWFLICDANNLHMDEATISRIAQNPMTVSGPTRAEDYAHLLRDLLLADLARHLPEEGWELIGERMCAFDLSGRNVSAIAGNIRSHVQDFEYPDTYFSASSAERQRIIEDLSRAVSPEEILGFIQDWADSLRTMESQAEEERFEREVAAIVRQLNVNRAAAKLISED